MADSFIKDLPAGSLDDNSLFVAGNSLSNPAGKITVPQMRSFLGNRMFTIADGGSPNYNCNSGNVGVLTIAGSRSVTFSNFTTPSIGIIIIRQGGSGGYTITWPAYAVLPTGGLALSPGVGETTVIGFIWDGTNLLLTKENFGATIGGDVTAPTVVSLRVEDATKNRIDILFNEALDSSSVPAIGDFTIAAGKTITGVAIVGSTVRVTVSSNYAFGDSIGIGYTPGTNKIKDTSGNLAAAITYSLGNVTNSVGAPTAANLIFTVTGSASYASQIYTATSNAAFGHSAGNAPAGQESFIYMEIEASLYNSATFGFGTVAATPYSFSTIPYGVIPYGGSYQRLPGLNTLSIAPVAGDFIGVRRNVSGVVTIEKSTDSGATWTVIYTYAGTETGILYPVFGIVDMGDKIVRPKKINII